MLCQLEMPDEAVISAWEQATGFFCLNAAPARPIDVDADLTVVNRHELEVLRRRDGLVALTLGAEGAVLLEDGEEVARAEPPAGRGRGRNGGRRCVHGLPARLAPRGPRPRGGAAPRVRRRRARRVALRRATLAADRGGGGRDTAPVSDVPVILDCDPGHDDAIALLLALASPEIELVGVTTTHGNQTLEKTTDNALRVLALRRPGGRAGRRGRRPSTRARAARRRARPRRERPRRAGAAASARPSRSSSTPSSSSPSDVTPETVLVAVGPLTNVALALDRGVRPARIVLMGGAIGEGNITPAAEFNIWADPEAAQRSSTPGST